MIVDPIGEAKNIEIAKKKKKNLWVEFALPS
jgi:hypothetical protein